MDGTSFGFLLRFFLSESKLSVMHSFQPLFGHSTRSLPEENSFKSELRGRGLGRGGGGVEEGCMGKGGGGRVGNFKQRKKCERVKVSTVILEPLSLV